MRAVRAVIFLLVAASLPCPARGEDVPFVVLQMNDVYEIVPLQVGGPPLLARAATLRAQLVKENSRTYSVIAGDFFSPSPMMDAKDEHGRRLAGRQMVGVLKALGLDYATFGNHEFDLKRDEFYRWFGDADFRWVSSNVSKPDGTPFHGVPRSRVVSLFGDGGSEVRVGWIGLTIDSNKVDYVRYGDPFAAARAQVSALRGACDVLIAVTHLERVDDKRLAAAVPEIDLILGGHDHVRSYDLPDEHRHAPVAKADANARTVFVHRLSYDTRNRVLRIHSELHDLEREPLADDGPTMDAIRKHSERAFDGLRGNIKDPALKKAILDQLAKASGGPAPAQVDFTAGLVKLPKGLDGREKSIRFGPTDLTNLLTGLMLENLKSSKEPAPGGPKPDDEPGLAVLNSGSIRIDAQLPPGMTRLYDIDRILPYTIRVVSVKMRGRLLKQLLFEGTSVEMRGEGAFLQTSTNVKAGDKPGEFKVDDRPIEDGKAYRVAINDYLLKGGEARLAKILKPRGKDDLLALDLNRDGIAVMGVEEMKDPEEKARWSIDDLPDLLSALIRALIAHEEDPAYFARLGGGGKDDPLEPWPDDNTFRLEVRCGMTASDDGYPAPAPATAPIQLPLAADPPHPPATSAATAPPPPVTINVPAPPATTDAGAKDTRPPTDPCCDPRIELVKALAWPLTALAIALLFHRDMRLALLFRRLRQRASHAKPKR